MDETLRNAMKIVQVRTYSGCRADQEPRTFILNGKEFKVDEVLSSYYRYDIRKGRLYRGYRVKADEGEPMSWFTMKRRIDGISRRY